MIPLYKPFMPELPHLDEILNSGKLAYGNFGKKFEKKLAEFISVDNIITTNSFNMALLVALTTLGIKTGDSVIASPMACLASTQPLLSAGLKILWADVDPKTGTLNPMSVKELIKFNPKVIIHNHFCGYIGHIDEINQIGKNHNIPVIDDGIEAFGSEYKGKKLGNVGTDITVFSFSPVRIPNTVDGGAIVFNDKKLYEKSILIRDAGIDREKFRDEIGEINPDYDISIVGHSATMSELNSYIGLQQMNFVEEIIQKQRANARFLREKFILEIDLIPILNENTNPNFWVFGTLSNNKQETIARLREKGIYASGVHINNNRYSVFGEYHELIGVEEFYSKFVALPSGWWINYYEFL